jgi:hypothetical protein
MVKDEKRIKAILAAVKPLAAEYYRLTGKPLGVTGEVAEYVAAEKLKLVLVPPRTAGHGCNPQNASGQRTHSDQGSDIWRRFQTKPATREDQTGRCLRQSAPGSLEQCHP